MLLLRAAIAGQMRTLRIAVQSRTPATRERTIDAAVESFADHGFAGTGLDDIAEAVGMATGAFRYHLGSQEALASDVFPTVLT